MTYNRSQIMKDAWASYNFFRESGVRISFGDCLAGAWETHKKAMRNMVAAMAVTRIPPAFLVEYQERGGDWQTAARFNNECDAYRESCICAKVFFDRTYRVRAA